MRLGILTAELKASLDSAFCCQVKRDALFEKHDWKCAYCGEGLVVGDTRRSPCIDHVLPQSLGGKENDENLVACCRSCNSSKGSLTIEDWRLWQAGGYARYRIYNQGIALEKIRPEPTQPPRMLSPEATQPGASNPKNVDAGPQKNPPKNSRDAG